MRHLPLALACLLLPAAAAADGVYRRETELRREVEPAVRGCGGDAFSFAEVAEGPLAHRGGPVVSVPDTLCADLAPQGRPAVGPIAVYPNLGAGTGRESTPGGLGPSLRRPGRPLPPPPGGIRPVPPHISLD